jgi:hypothetical protein
MNFLSKWLRLYNPSTNKYMDFPIEEKYPTMTVIEKSDEYSLQLVLKIEDEPVYLVIVFPINNFDTLLFFANASVALAYNKRPNLAKGVRLLLGKLKESKELTEQEKGLLKNIEIADGDLYINGIRKLKAPLNFLISSRKKEKFPEEQIFMNHPDYKVETQNYKSFFEEYEGLAK